jgi:predicted dehydrogenase
MDKLWKVAVIGCGTFANKQYLPYIRKEANAEIVAAVDIVVERARKASEE